MYLHPSELSVIYGRVLASFFVGVLGTHHITSVWCRVVFSIALRYLHWAMNCFFYHYTGTSSISISILVVATRLGSKEICRKRWYLIIVVSGMGLVQCGWCSTCASRYITWIEVSVSAGCWQGYTVICGDCESITCMTRSVKRVERACEGISVCNAWGV